MRSIQDLSQTYRKLLYAYRLNSVSRKLDIVAKRPIGKKTFKKGHWKKAILLKRPLKKGRSEKIIVFVQ